MKNSELHSPVPESAWNLTLIGENRFGKKICNLYRGCELMAEYLLESDARPIMVQLNSHAALVEALKACYAQIEILVPKDGGMVHDEFMAMVKAREALALAAA